MVRQTKSETAIEKLSPAQSLTPNQKRTALVGEYLYKYATIANRDLGKGPEMVQFFMEGLSDLDDKELERGLKNYLQQGTRFPWPADIRELSDLS